MPKEVRVRMAPSPTGFLHVGGLRTALYNFLFARKQGGKFILRVEDTDRARLVEGALENIVQTLTEFNLAPDEGFYWDNGVKERGDYGPYLQSKRLDIYKKHAEELIAKGAAYFCFCSTQRLEDLRKQQETAKTAPKYDKHCLNIPKEEIQQKISANEQHVVRLNVPKNESIKFNDLVHGEITISTNDIDDQVLLKSDGYPTYHLAVVVDDHLMQISHVIRGDEWIPSTPKHVLLYRAFGWELPEFVHLPLLLSKSKKKLSKREGDVAVKDFVAQGYLPEALVNFVAFLGWNPKTEQEIFNLIDLIDQFALEKINKAGAVFDLEKLDWLNSQYIRQLPIEDLFGRIAPYLKETGINFETYSKEFLFKILEMEKERLKKLSEIGERVRYFFQEPDYEASLLIWKDAKRETIAQNLQKFYNFLQTLPDDKFKKEILESETKEFVQSNSMKNGEVLWPARVALSGLSASPGPFEIMDAFGVLPDGKQTILKRINRAIEMLF